MVDFESFFGLCLSPMTNILDRQQPTLTGLCEWLVITMEENKLQNLVS